MSEKGPPRTASNEAKAGEKTPRSSCQTIQRNQRAEGRVPRSSTQAGSRQSVQRKFQGKGTALESHGRKGNCQMISWNQPGKGKPVESPTGTRSARAKARGKEWKLTDEHNREGTPTPDDEISGRRSLQPDETNDCTTADGLKITVCITKSGLRKGWQPSIASRKICVTIIVSFANKQWPLSAARQQIFTCSRCKRDIKPCRLYSADNDMDPGSVPAELQASVKSRNWWLRERSRLFTINTEVNGDTKETYSICLKIFKVFWIASRLTSVACQSWWSGSKVQVSVSKIILHTGYCTR